MDPNLSSVEGEALRLGVRFLYTQASELLKRRRERGAEPEPESGPESEAAQPPTEIDRAALDRLAGDMERLQEQLAPYADGERPISPEDESMVRSVVAQRRVLERILGRDLSFEGENRASTGVHVDIDDLHGEAVGATGAIPQGTQVNVDVGSVGSGGRVVGAEFKDGR